jgi:hypothetical protein
LVAWNWKGDGNNAVLQPVLIWESNGSRHAYYMFSDLNDTANQYNSESFAVSPGDVIENWIDQVDGSPDPDEWEVTNWDTTTGIYTSFYVGGIPSTYSKFNTAYIVLEGFGAGGETTTLPSCTDLSPADSVTYNILTFDLPTPAWNSYTPYSGPNLWSGSTLGGTDFPPSGPSCSWGTSVATPYETVRWVP